MDYKIKDISLASWGHKEIAIAETEMPGLIAVREEFRGKNIGSELIQHLIDKSKELGCYKVILSCFPERINFYEKNGFSNESITMRHNLK